MRKKNNINTSRTAVALLLWGALMGGLLGGAEPASSPKPPGGEQTLYAGTAAKVGESLILISDVYAFEVIQKFLKDPLTPVRFVQPEPQALIPVVQQLIFQTMVLKEIEKFSITTVTRAQSQARFDKLLKAKGSVARQHWKKILNHFDLSGKQALDVVWDIERSEAFFKKKIDTLTPIITQSELENALVGDSKASSLKGKAFEDYRARRMLEIKKKKVEKGLDEWIKTLRDRYGVTSYLEG